MNCLKIILIAACIELCTHLGINVQNDFTSKQITQEIVPTKEITTDIQPEADKATLKYFPIRISVF